MDKPIILIAEPEVCVRRSLTRKLRQQGYEIHEYSHQSNLLHAMDMQKSDLIILGTVDHEISEVLSAAEEIRHIHNDIPIILIVENGSEELAVAALRAGISDYYKKPIKFPQLLSAIRNLLDSQKNGTLKLSGEASSNGYAHLIGQSAAMQAVKKGMAKISGADSAVLITGETGTGKSLVAQLLHKNSPRQDKPFIQVNSAAIPENLLESELFGFERGAFTGAVTGQPGKFELANGGTLLLDEIGELSLQAQAKILHALESHEIYRLGGRHPIHINVRLLSATNQDPEKLIAERKFRKDLFYRLNVARIHLPPLRERKEDIPLLLDHYIQLGNRRFGLNVQGLSEAALKFLLHYEWPGNVRELKNLIEACFINLPSAETTELELPAWYIQKIEEIEHKSFDEREQLLRALFTTNWNVSQAAAKLHWSRMTVYRKMKRHQIVRPDNNHRETC